MMSRRLEVLTDGHNVTLRGPQIVQDAADLVERFTHAHDQARLRRHAPFFRTPEYLQRPQIFALRANRRKEPRNRFNVVVQNIRVLPADDGQCRLIAFKVRDQHFNRTIRIDLSGASDRVGKDNGPPIRQLITIDRGDDSVAQPECLYGIGHALWLLDVHGAWATGFDRAVMAASRTDIPENQKCGRPGIPTFPPVGTAGFLADRMELELIDRLLDVQVIRAGLGLDFEPG